MDKSVVVPLAELLIRADEVALQDMIGQTAVGALATLDPRLGRASHLRKTLRSIYTEHSLVRQFRSVLLDMLSRDEAMEVCERVGAAGDDPFVALRKVRIPRQSPRESRLFQCLGVVPELVEQRQAPASTEIAQPLYGLFPHQRLVLRRLDRFVKSDDSRVLVHMPTGSGKTRTMANAIAEHLRARDETLVVWLAHSEELCDQAFDELVQAWRCLGDRPVSFHKWWGEHEIDLRELSDAVVVAGLAKITARIQRDAGVLPALASRASLVIMDEAHQAVAPSYRLILETLTYGGTSVVGLSATPGRTWNDMDEDARLAEFFDRNKVGVSLESGQNPVDYLIENEFLARPKFETLNSEVGVRLTDRDFVDIESGLDIPRRVLSELGTSSIRLIRVVQRIQQLAKDHSHILLFAPTVASAADTAIVLTALGIEARSVTSDTPNSERRRVLEDYKRSVGPTVLCNYGVLTTGFDAPRTSAAVIARPTTSLVLYFQMVGRALRGPRAGGNRDAQIVTVVDLGLPGFRDVGEAFLNWEDVW